MRVFLTTLPAILPSILRSRAAVELENLALRHQIGVLQRSAAKRLKLTSGDRVLWICLSRLWRDWRSALAICQARTVSGLTNDCSGLGRCGTANLDDRSFRARPEI